MSSYTNPVVKIATSISSDGLSFILNDITGNYSGTNTGGYNAPNIPSADVTQVLVRIYQYGQTIPTLLTFTVLSNIITAATLTTPAGIVTNILSDLASTVWPFDNITPYNLTITNVYLGFAATDKITDQVWTFSYEISGSYFGSDSPVPFDLITSVDLLVNCTTCCCIKKMAANLKPDCCSCGNNLMQYLKAKAMLESAQASADIGQYDSAQCALIKASELCNCKNCN